jgi:hypothetical protein
MNLAACVGESGVRLARVCSYSRRPHFISSRSFYVCASGWMLHVFSDFESPDFSELLYACWEWATRSGS